VLPRGARQCCEAGLRVTRATPVSLVARELGTAFLFLPWRLLVTHSDMRPCCTLRQRYTMPCCPQAATPASARTVWGYEMIRGSSSSSSSSSSSLVVLPLGSPRCSKVSRHAARYNARYYGVTTDKGLGLC
jgi:hypothetical protein